MDTTTTLILYILIGVAVYLLGSSHRCAFSYSLENKSGEVVNMKERRSFNLIIAFFILWFFFAFSDCGGDYDIYRSLYEQWTWDFNSYLMVGYEKGYVFLNVLLKSIVPNSHVGMTLIKSIILGNIFYAIYHERNKIDCGLALLSLFCLFYHGFYTYFRLAMAVSIMTIGFCKYAEGKTWRFLITVLIACTFHQTAISCLIIFLLTKIVFKDSKINPKRIALCAFVALFFIFAQELILNILSNYIPFLGKYTSDHYTRSSGGAGIVSYLYYVPPIIMTYIGSRRSKENKIDVLGFSACIFCIFVQVIRSLYSGEIDRLLQYSLFVFVIYIPYYIEQKKRAYIQYSGRYLFSPRDLKIIYIFYNILRFLVIYFLISGASTKVREFSFWFM